MSDPTSTLAPQLAFQPQAIPTQGGSSNSGRTGAGPGFQPFGEDGLTFLDFIDVINPLQHIPLVSTLYRNLTGDTLDPAMNIAGGALFGGPIGAAASLVNVIIGESTGKDMGEHVMSFLSNTDMENVDDEDTPFPEGATFAEKNSLALSHAEVLQWAQGEVGTATASSSFDKATDAELAVLKSETEHASVSSSEHIEVRQWAQRQSAPDTTMAAEQSLRIGGSIHNEASPVISGAELEVLRAEAEAVRAAEQIASLHIAKTGAAKEMAVSNFLSVEELGVSENIEVLRWARQENDDAARKHLLSEQASPNESAGMNSDGPSPGAVAQQGGWFSDVMLSALNNYDKGASLATRPAASVVNRKD